MYANATTRLDGRIGILAMSLAGLVILLAGCDSSTADVIREVEAAREGCTEEKLKAADEECVQMFEQYAEMGGKALESYIGAMRSLDAALQRRGGLRFDTTGLGRVFTAPRTFSAADSFDNSSPPLAGSQGWESAESDGPTWEMQNRTWGSSPEVDAATAAMTAPQEDRRSVEYRAAQGLEEGGRQLPARRQPAASSRGVIRPPEERLRRPWLDADTEPATEAPAVPTRPALPPDDRQREPSYPPQSNPGFVPQSGAGWDGIPYEDAGRARPR